jgi:SAM-dependent methyltransferase
LADRVTHLCGDALEYPIDEQSFDAVATWMVIHHILDRPRLCRKIAAALRSGGTCYIEDLYLKQPISGQDLADVRHVLYGMSVTDLDEFLADLRNSGLVDVVPTDLTSEVTPFVFARLASWQSDEANHRRQFGNEAYAALEHFFRVVARLFMDGKIGCARLTASSPT